MEAESPMVSFVIPCHNEAENLRPLTAAIREAIKPLDASYEIVVTDDFSTDQSWSVLKEIAGADPRIRAQRFAYNCGQSAAMWAGMKAARGGRAETAGRAEAFRLRLRHAHRGARRR